MSGSFSQVYQMAKFFQKPGPRRCCVCGGERIEPFAPNNNTIVPCCRECFGNLPALERLTILQRAQQIDVARDIFSILDKWAEGVAAEMISDRLASRISGDN